MLQQAKPPSPLALMKTQRCIAISTFWRAFFEEEASRGKERQRPKSKKNELRKLRIKDRIRLEGRPPCSANMGDKVRGGLPDAAQAGWFREIVRSEKGAIWPIFRKKTGFGGKSRKASSCRVAEGRPRAPVSEKEETKKAGASCSRTTGAKFGIS